MTRSRDATLLTVTSTDLLAALRDSTDDSAWQAFVERYRPLIVRYAQRLGARRDDGEDIAQLALAAFASAYRQGGYDREKGRLRDWLFGIARNQAMSWFRQQARRAGGDGQAHGDSDATSLLARIGDEESLQQIWEQEWREAVLRECLGEARRSVQPTTYEAFELFAGRGWSAERVAEHLGITPNAVFGAKRRVLEQIKTLRPVVEERW